MDKITITYPRVQKYFFDEDDKVNLMTLEVSDLSKISDGYHTIAELYDHRITLYIALAKSIYERSGFGVSSVWRSKKHSDGTDAYEGWFVLGIGKKAGDIITYHIPLSRWDETNFAETVERGFYDGHTSNDVLERLKSL